MRFGGKYQGSSFFELLEVDYLEDKFSSYLFYVLDGHMVKQYPQYAGKRVRIELDCAGQPGSREQALLTAMRNFAASEALGFRVNVALQPPE